MVRPLYPICIATIHKYTVTFERHLLVTYDLKILKLLLKNLCNHVFYTSAVMTQEFVALCPAVTLNMPPTGMEQAWEREHPLNAA